MRSNYKESFEQIKVAGTLAAETLDEVTSFVKALKTGVKILCYDCKLNSEEIKLNKQINYEQ